MSITFSLTIIKSGKPGQTFTVDQQHAAMGRHSEYNDIVINDPYISSKHARITFNSGRFYLEDLGSTNKTFVNGVALAPSKPVALSDGMEFTLGKTGFCFHYQPSKEPAPVNKKEMGRVAAVKELFGAVLHDLNKKKIRYTPVLLGIVLWALVMVLFLFVKTTLNH